MPKPSTPRNKKSKSRSRVSKTTSTPALPTIPEPLTYEEAQKMVQFEINGHCVRVNINDSLQLHSKEDFPDDNESDSKCNKEEPKAEETKEPQLPEACYKRLDDYNIADAPPRPNAYIRFIEKSAEELDGEVEYDVDEEDTAWLAIVNKKREDAGGLAPVSVDSLELLMDRLEKESYFQASASGHSGGSVVDDDAVCCICMDGECQNTNVILFCDMCNLAVHQDCYGVPYIPEGQWLCRRCLQSPSRAVDCVLCPNQGGAFKQTDNGLWAHVVCALWIPEVRFANTVFLEPIDSIEMIPAARWKLVCYVCKQKNVGACIQCHKTNCYSAFHVTCAQSAGLYMKMDTVKDSGGDSQPVLVQKIAYCDAHAPPDFDDTKKEDSKQKMKNARKLLAKKRGTVPVILIPTIPADRIQEIGSLVTIQKKSQFIQRLIAYWTLKRQYRNGVPLLRRLQSAQGGTRDSNTSNVDTIELCRQLKYWQCLRQDLERARLLCELVRKREKLKLELIKSQERCLDVQFRPLEAALRKVISVIASKDTHEIFLEPVDLDEVPDYTTIVKRPIDLSTMRQKVDDGCYATLDDVERDFDLMINNCFEYNDKDTVFYRAALKMREQGKLIFKQARLDMEEAGLLRMRKGGKEVESTAAAAGEESGSASALNDDEDIAAGVLKEFETLKGKSGAEIKDKLDSLLLKCQAIKHNLSRTKRIKQIRGELQRLKRTESKSGAAVSLVPDTSSSSMPMSQSDGETDVTDVKLQTNNATTSPTGVNRRTAVLFTRKAQAALKKPAEETPMDTTTIVSPVAKQNKKGKSTKTLAHNVNLCAGAVVPTSPKPPPHVAAAARATAERDGGGGNNNTSEVPDSFKQYRASNKSSNDEDSDSATSLSTCYSHELSEIDSDSSSSSSSSSASPAASLVDQDDRDDDEAMAASKENLLEEDEADDHQQQQQQRSKGSDEPLLLDLKPMQLVWAKSRGYPWYPALIIDPQMPKAYVYKGVPIPFPPAEVMNLRTSHAAHVYLVLFFDAKRTWQWLPAEKLELLGADDEKDQAKVNEPRKPTERKAVKKAYQDAMLHISQTGSFKETAEKCIKDEEMASPDAETV